MSLTNAYTTTLNNPLPLLASLLFSFPTPRSQVVDHGVFRCFNLNDFITPSQACIKPVEQTNKPAEKQKDVGAAATEIHIDESGTYYEVSQNGTTSNAGVGRGKKLEQAQISLNDCLACSGCITSAESVLITLQSHTEVLSVLSNETDERIPIISIAPQSLASLAAAYSSQSSLSTSTESTSVNGSATDDQLTPREIFHRIREFCTSILGFAYVFDTNFARHLALKEHVREFLERQKYHRVKTGGNLTPPPSLLTPEEALPLPMLASACPGWICYAEKAHSEMLPFIARTKSPQQVTGTLVKKWIARKLGKRPNEIYHVSVMPCYDKKLEASRQDFFDEIFQSREVDCVVTTGELELMMKELGWDLRTAALQPLTGTTSPSPSIPIKKSSIKDLPTIDIPELLTHPGTSSGSYLHAIIHHFISTSPVPLTLSVKAIRNADYEEYILCESSDDGTPRKIVFKGVKCYGFRNLQNVVRKVGRQRGNFDYVEVMACPGGCVNGGGQLRPPTIQTPPTSLSTSSGDVDAEGYKRDWDGEGVAPSLVDEIIKELCAGDDHERKRLLRTEYRAVESDVIGLAVKW
ncbi:Cytosolic Fe-S cluster assembly factor NAR1 [Leucoagaricus sp. SymC.cos]|nr:Cytosolic Fe-S cluster assembly factor NAR1 [Leucoagaricus sp. SymC.cos]